MADSYLYTVANNVATFSINDPLWNLLSIEYIDPFGRATAGSPG